jgi:hypothetical protein
MGRFGWEEANLSDSCDIMSDMASERITVRVSRSLGDLLKNRSRLKGQTPSEVVRVALESYFSNGGGPSAYELAEASGLIGCVAGQPQDLSTNRRHFEGFGQKN